MVKLSFLWEIASTLNPIVGIVVTTSPSTHMYKRVVFPVVYQVIIVTFMEQIDLQDNTAVLFT